MTTKDCCVFTIVSKNYLHYAINLMASVATHFPEARLVVALCDRPDGLDLQSLPFEVISLEDVNIPHLDKLLVQYSILELNTAIKPFVFAHLFRTAAHDKVIYFDPDIQLFSSGQPLLAALQRARIVLTPHLTDFLDDDKQPSEVAILQSGTYNLGFLALARSTAASRLLAWWQEKLLHYCIVDIPNGLFTDQKWMDLVPGIFPEAEIVRHPGWNVAYWNLKHRHIEEVITNEVKNENVKNQFLVNGQPLFFFHFSGLELGSARISKHQNRFDLTDLPKATQRLFEIYNRGVDLSGRDCYAKLPYAFAFLHSGIRMPDVGRGFLRRTLDWSQSLPDFRTEAGEQHIISLLNAPIDRRKPVITRLAETLYRARADLIAAFPDLEGVHRVAYVDWFVANATAQSGIDPIFITPMQAANPHSTLTEPAPQSPSAFPVSAPQPARGGNAFYTLLYRLAWKLRALVRPFIGPGMRHRLRMLLLRKAYHAQITATSAPAPVPVVVSAGGPVVQGVNVIGYLNAESGVGESARSMLRALNAQSVAHATVNYHVGNMSRQGERIDTSGPAGLHHGINLFHINADQIGVAQEFLGAEFFESRYRIGYWAWELGEFPDQWLSSFAPLNEIWVPSTFCQKAIANKSPVPVVCIPHTVIIPESEHADRARFGLREDTVCFLSMADMLSIPERKNPLGAVEAFVKAFAGDDSAELIVKLSNSDSRKDFAATLRQHAANHSNIHLIEGYLSREDVFTLIQSVDCFVSLHRSEGFGLVIAEAMARAKVVIATGWSGNMEFMNPGNALAVDYTLVELAQDHGPYRQGQIWAEPDLNDAAAKMRAVCADPALRQKIGARARLDCIQQLNAAQIGKLVQRRIEAIYQKL